MYVTVQQAYLDVEAHSTLNRTVQPIIVKLCSRINTLVAEGTTANLLMHPFHHMH